MNTTEFNEEIREVNGFRIRITTYKIGDQFHCHISNSDPGATISRASSSIREQAIEEALRKASDRLAVKKN